MHAFYGMYICLICNILIGDIQVLYFASGDLSISHVNNVYDIEHIVLTFQTFPNMIITERPTYTAPY